MRKGCREKRERKLGDGKKREKRGSERKEKVREERKKMTSGENREKWRSRRKERKRERIGKVGGKGEVKVSEEKESKIELPPANNLLSSTLCKLMKYICLQIYIFALVIISM